MILAIKLLLTIESVITVRLNSVRGLLWSVKNGYYTRFLNLRYAPRGLYDPVQDQFWRHQNRIRL